MAENRPQKFRKSIFEVKKSNFLFDSINVSGMYCNLSNTFKRFIFTFLKLWHIAKATFADSTKLKNGRKATSEIWKIHFWGQKIKFSFWLNKCFWNVLQPVKHIQENHFSNFRVIDLNISHVCSQYESENDMRDILDPINPSLFRTCTAKNYAVLAKDVSSLSDLQCMHETMMDLLDQEFLLFHSEIHANGKRALCWDL